MILHPRGPFTPYSPNMADQNVFALSRELVIWGASKYLYRARDLP